jgi:hypothetical protein
MRIVLGLLPFLALGAMGLAFYFHQLRAEVLGGTLLRKTLLQTAAAFGLWVVVGTELLSALSILSFWPILVWWLIPLVGSLIHLFQNRGRIRLPRAALNFTICEWLVLTVLVVFTGLALATAIFSPPNNYDSYSYHLPRQVMWMQQHSVRDYPTNNLRQLIMPPFVEFVGLHIWSLANSDRLLNLVQWSAMVLMFVAASLLAKRLCRGRSVLAQLLACLLIIGDPIIFMQASSTKNDMVVGMWILICAWWLLRVLDGWELRWPDAVLFGSAIGCCALSKGTGPMFVLPIVVVLTIAMLWRRKRKAFGMLVVMGGVSMAINVPHYARNLTNFGHLDQPPVAKGGYAQYNLQHTPAVVMSNLLRILAEEAALPNQQFDQHLYDGIEWIHRHWLGLGINDAENTTPFSEFVRPTYRPADEDHAGSPLHVAFLLIAPVGLLLTRRNVHVGYAVLLTAIAAVGFLILNGVLKWEEWNVRFFIAVTGLMCPVMAAVLANWRGGGVISGIVAAVIALTLIPAMKHSSRPLFGRFSVVTRDDLSTRMFYIGNWDDIRALADIARIRNVRWVGLDTDGDSPDYIYMYVIRRHMKHAPRFEYIDPYIRVVGPAPHRADMVVAGPGIISLVDETGVRYELFRRFTKFNVLLPQH